MNEPAQLGLALTGEGFSGPAEASGLLSMAYISRHLVLSEDFASGSTCDSAYRLACECIQRHGAALRMQNEAFTCSEFIEPVLDALAWRRIPQQSMPAGMSGICKRPDYCLLGSDEAFHAATSGDAETLFRLSATVLEAKRWGHPLDRVSARETPGLFPSQQIQDYLNHAKDAAGKRYFDWAILTNGCEWRLYTDKAAVGAHFSFHLVRDGQICSREDFRLFYTLFRAAAFERDRDGICFLDSVREQSLRVQAELESNLRKRVFGVLEDLGTAFVDYEDNRLSTAELPIVYEKSLIFLYRLLFVLYAESRGLLPVREHGAGANRRYLSEFSLARLTGRLRDRSLYVDNAFCTLYEELVRLFNLVNGTHPRQNAALKVTRYNGGLFSTSGHEELERWRIGDRDLADVLRQLIFAQPPARRHERQSRFSTDEAIDYSTLEVRQLGDIYEGLLGAHFEQVGGRLELHNENGENHRHGIFYTPDWIVMFLVRETLGPLLDTIEQSDEVRQALHARSDERRRNNTFALGVLRLNLVDPAMGSGHFLVRATEWLAERIMSHPTTQPMTRQIVSQGDDRITREQILALGKIPVSPGVAQEHAEKAYWRRRVVEACIHGVDINPMAVELAKLSLWLTCIAADEPLNFLDHHLRQGNALLAVDADELRQAPVTGGDEETTFDLGDRLQTVLSSVIGDTLRIQGSPSTEMDHVKEKEQLWKDVRKRLEPFLELATLWLSALDGVPIDALNYLSAARLLLKDKNLTAAEKRDAKRFLASIAADLAQRRRDLKPFHWQLEFPDVFFDESGALLPPESCGFDAVLGNPPYVSIHTAMEPSNRKMRDALERRAGYVEDLYVHFTDLGFARLRAGGGFGFIVSDTFFTLASKLRMRDMLQRRTIDWLGQCDPFDATVDAAVFVARKQPPQRGHQVRFVQARPLKRPDGSRTAPERNLDSVPPGGGVTWHAEVTDTSQGVVRHAVESELRLHTVPQTLYTTAHKRAFFEPRPGTLRLFARFNDAVKDLVDAWWERIEDSRVFSANIDRIRAYHRDLNPGDVTLVGLIAEGGQGMRTANNARFLAYLDGTPQADTLKEKADEWSIRWLAHARVGPVFRERLREAGGDPAQPTADRAAWEAAVHGLRVAFPPATLGFGRTALFRIAPTELIAGEADFAYAFQCRKAELLRHWQGQTDLQYFWCDPMEVDGATVTHAEFRQVDAISDADFCMLCGHIRLWVTRENAARNASQRIPADVIGLRSSEDYADPADAPRVATVYNGLYGRARFVPFRKGDPTGSRWLDNEPLYCEWTRAAVHELSTNAAARWQGHRFFMTPGVTWSLHANHVAAKCRYQDPCVFDASSSRLTPAIELLSATAFVAIANSQVFSFFLKRFIKHNQDIEINDMRAMPVRIPTQVQHAALEELATLAMAAKRHEFAESAPDDTLVARVREIGEVLRAGAPAYLRPSAQGQLLSGPADCLEVIEKAVNWEAEKLYGVEGNGPFDEF